MQEEKNQPCNKKENRQKSDFFLNKGFRQWKLKRQNWKHGQILPVCMAANPNPNVNLPGRIIPKGLVLKCPSQADGYSQIANGMAVNQDNIFMRDKKATFIESYLSSHK